jgi:hypothetical protein
MDIVVKGYIYKDTAKSTQTHAHYIQATRTLKYPQIGVQERYGCFPCDELLQKPVGEVLKMVVPEPIDG